MITKEIDNETCAEILIASRCPQCGAKFNWKPEVSGASFKDSEVILWAECCGSEMIIIPKVKVEIWESVFRKKGDIS